MNFDAETKSERLERGDYQKIYALGASWSETLQASACSIERSGEEEDAHTTSKDSISIFSSFLKSFGRRLSANLVVGNSAYGLRPDIRAFERDGTRLALLSMREVKLGAEGMQNGRKAIDLAERTNSIAYILHTPAAADLMRYADSLGVRFVVYTLCRFSETTSSAVAELLRMKGTGYFEWRGVLRDNVASSLRDFALFGTREDVVKGIRRFIDGFGASKVVLYPVFEGHRDLLGQARALAKCLS